MTRKTVRCERTRMGDSFSFRLSTSQRVSIEKIADEKGFGLCEAARYLLNIGIEQSKISEV